MMPVNGDGRLGGDGQPVSGNEWPVSGDGRPVSGDRRPVSGDGRLVSGDGRPVSGDRRPVSETGWPTRRIGLPGSGHRWPVRYIRRPTWGEILLVSISGRPVNDEERPVCDEGRPVRDEWRPVRGEGRPVRGEERPVRGEGRPVRGDRCRTRFQVALIVLLVMMSATKAAADVPDNSAEDCRVYHVEKNHPSPKTYFREKEVVLGLLPQYTTAQVLSGITFTVNKHNGDVILSAQVPTADPNQLVCSWGKNRTESLTLGTFKKERQFQWHHISLSIKTGSLVVNGSYVVCPGAQLDDQAAYVVVTPKRAPINIVANCQHACPIFFNSTLARIKNNYLVNDKDTEEVFLRATSHEARVHLQLSQCKFCYESERKEAEEEVILTASSIDSYAWEQLRLETPPLHTLVSGILEIFLTGKEIKQIIFVLRVGGFIKVLSRQALRAQLHLTEAHNIAWSVGCDPRDNRPYWTTDSGPKTADSKTATNYVEQVLMGSCWEWVIVLLVVVWTMIICQVFYCCLLRTRGMRLKEKQRSGKASNDYSTALNSSGRRLEENVVQGCCPESTNPPPSSGGRGEEDHENHYYSTVEEEEHVYEYVDLEALKQQLDEDKRKNSEGGIEEVGRMRAIQT